MLKKVFLMVLCAALLAATGLMLTACNNTEEVNPVQTFIDENREMLDEVSADHLSDLGPGATVDFQAGDNEFIYVYTWGPGPTAEELEEATTSFLDMPANVVTYENLANSLASLMELEALTLTVSYYDGQGELVMTRSFEATGAPAAE